ncbi:hypothetical protein Mag101_09575 [Microbulbifer agarilyticus]|uniref:DUF1838 domain-containing protein n=1 Tax=Microbulbifer agarilyticus TaxID=260552 RepID=A0A1Q2M551_9GAMM|nr:DUF1838 family protein [Microbulbifer agarilyticus]AQQ67865.1 hypothetical protein Mag101_09575 [Microbulbifer agarilyticus]
MSDFSNLLRRFLRKNDKYQFSPRSQIPLTAKPLDWNDAKDNLYAFGKLWATYDEKPVFSAFHGLMFGLVGTQRAKPLFGYCGLGQFQARLLANGNVRLRGKETGYFYDPANGKILRDWLNPYTGERVEVYNFLNDRIRGELTPVMPKFNMGDGDDPPTLMNEATAIVNEDGSVPFILPWQQFGNNITLEWDYTHRYRNPVTPELWPKASTGTYINPSEHFTFSSPLHEMLDRDIPSASFSSGFSRISPWWPWMKMGQSGIDGVLFGRMNSHKSNNGYADIPRSVLEYTEKYHPEYLEPCTDWDDGFPIGTWEAYARDIAPEADNQKVQDNKEVFSD